MKSNNGIKKLSLKLYTGALHHTRALAAEVFGGKEIYTEPGLAVFELQDGNILEIYGPGSNYPAYLFSKSNLVMSYRVNDLERAIADAKRSGMMLISPEQPAGACYNYSHLKDSEGNIIELNQDKT